MARDPKTMITPDAFTVAPELLGYALASPRQRLAAMLIDLLLGAILSKAGVLILMAVGAALVGWRIVGGSAERVAGRSRNFFRIAAAVLAVIVFFNVRDAVMDRLRSDDEPPASEPRLSSEAERAADNLNLSGSEGLAFTGHMLALNTGDTDARAEAASNFGHWVAQLDVDESERREVVQGLAELVPDELQTAYFDAAGIAADTTHAVPDTTLLEYATARAQGDTARARSLHPQAVGAVAGDSLALLAARIERLDRRNDELSQENEELEERAERRGGFITSAFSNLLDDLGIGFGWYALYFTAFIVLGRGQTPGKRLLKIKVLRLDNRPLTWWLAFERFGCYGACIATGLLGFAQILWDRNRQGLHDKAMETVVIRLDHGQPVKLDWQTPAWMRPQPPVR